MRSRYSAFVLGEREYLAETWHADYRPRDFAPDPEIRWLGLDVLDAEQCGDEAAVEFEARLLAHGRVEAMRERSRFVREHGRWLYTAGEPREPAAAPWKPGRNETCPCDSGRKFKHCCGRG